MRSGHVTLRVELRERAVAGGAQGRGHPELVALLVRRVADPDGDGPAAHRRGGHLTFGPRELLRVADAAQVLGWRHDRAHGDRPGPRPTTDLVDPAHHLVAGVPEPSLEPQGRERRSGRRSAGTVRTLPTGRRTRRWTRIVGRCPSPSVSAACTRSASGRPTSTGRWPFYQDVLGLTFIAKFDPPGLAFFDFGNTRLLLENGAQSSILYLAVEDIDAAYATLQARGVEFDGRAPPRVPRRRRSVRHGRRGRVDGVLPRSRRQHARAARTPRS